MIFIHRESGELALLVIKSVKEQDYFCIYHNCFEIGESLILTNSEDKDINNFEFLGIL